MAELAVGRIILDKKFSSGALAEDRESGRLVGCGANDAREGCLRAGAAALTLETLEVVEALRVSVSFAGSSCFAAEAAVGAVR